MTKNGRHWTVPECINREEVEQNQQEWRALLAYKEKCRPRCPAHMELIDEYTLAAALRPTGNIRRYVYV